jgi:hypothetical protein
MSSNINPTTSLIPTSPALLGLAIRSVSLLATVPQTGFISDHSQ